ncbi:MAG TPA: rhomboid family intramembrane serine protease [Gemmataceae bacterium]|jgi:rhomboid protease GluP|nr:rhomboid family intramembrane serine protease [Gemmataceae bacterium]
MTESIPDIREFILRQCAASAPNPWFPAVFARDNTIPRDHLDRHVDELRMAGLIQIADWVQGQGQGYALTTEGDKVLQSARDLARLRSGKLELKPEPQRVAADPTSWRGTSMDQGEIARQAVLYPAQPVVTRILIFVNIAVFALGMSMAMQRNLPLSEYLWGQDAVARSINRQIGALSGDMIARGQWIRLLTCCFVHFGLLHIGFNMYSLYVLGRIEEGMWGRLPFLALYLIAGVGGSCAMVINNPSPQSLGAGASGAIFGLFGALGTWIFLNRKHLGYGAWAWLRRLGYLLVLNIFISALPGISAAAHFGGFVVGIVGAVLLHAYRFGHGVPRWLALACFLALPALCIGAVLKAQAVDPRWAKIQAALALKDWEEVRHRVVTLWHEANQLGKSEVEPLLRRQAAKPDLETAQKLVAALGEEYQKLSDGAALLQKVGRVQDSDQADEVQDYAKQFLERLALLESIAKEEEKFLELSEKRKELKLTWKQQDEDEFQRQWQKMKEVAEVFGNAHTRR